MGGELLGGLLPSGRLDFCQGHACSECSQITPHEVRRFSAYTQAYVKSDIFMEIPIGFGVEG